MKRLILAHLLPAILMVTSAFSQSIEEGKEHIFAMRAASAIDHFQKIVSAAPSNAEAVYWLGQSYLETDELLADRLTQARNVYTSGLAATSNAPLVNVGMGHVELLGGQTESARQNFEAALLATKDKKGNNNPLIAYAIGRAIHDAEQADYAWGVRLLDEAVKVNTKSPEMWVLLGNLHRKANPGESGNQAFLCYSEAIRLDSAHGAAYLRRSRMAEKAQDYELQKSLLDKAVAKNPRFSAAYYDLYYYFLYRLKLPEAEEQLIKYIESKPVKELQDEFLYAQLCWKKTDYDCAISKTENLVAQLGAIAKPKSFRLLADAYYQRGLVAAKRGDNGGAAGDFANAKKNSDEFFIRKTADDYISYDHKLRADILSKTGGNKQEIYDNYVSGAALDTVMTSKLDFLKQGQAYFKENKIRDMEAAIIEQILLVKPKPTINDYFDLTLAYYFSNRYDRSRASAQKMIEKYPQQVYGYEWSFNNAMAIDTVRKDSIAVPDALKLNEFSGSDTTKFRKQYISSTRFLASYYINETKDRDQALLYFKKWLAVDPANAATIQSYITQIERMPPTPKPAGQTPPKTGSGPNPRPEARRP
ncbi:MAG: tetratricopeptide repeat protein [Bacteroidota bacterium]